MPDYNFITARLAVGGALAGSGDVAQIERDRITHVIDLRVDSDDAILFVGSPYISYLWNPTEDDAQHKGATWFRKSLEFALPALDMPRSKILVHCMAGVNRGPSTAYAILRACIGLDRALAEKLVRAARPQAELAYIHDADQAVVELGYVGA